MKPSDQRAQFENGKPTHNSVEVNLVQDTGLLPSDYIKCIGAWTINFTPGLAIVYTLHAPGVVMVDTVHAVGVVIVHLCFKHAQPKMCHSPKVENGFDNLFFLLWSKFLAFYYWRTLNCHHT